MQDEKQVKFEKGKVSEYNGQQDIYCDFVTVTQGTQQDVYYLLNDKKLDNGFYIASTVLKEAIDSQILRTHLGVINQKGDIIIPFENKSIKTIEDKYLLVVRSEAKTKSVLDAIASRNDPASAEKMVNANASIKDKLNKVMNNQGDELNGRFILNDLLSEGTVYTLDGKSVLDNQYYSFIGMTGDSFYCSINVPESSIAQFPRTDLFAVKPNGILEEGKVSEEEVLTDSVLPEVKPEIQDNPLDVSEVSITEDTIDKVLSATVPSKADDDTVEETRDIFTPVSIDKPVEVVESTIDTFTKQKEEPESDNKFNIVDVDSSNENQQDNSVMASENVGSDSLEADNGEQNEVIDVVHAVGNIVQINKDLKKQNDDLRARVSELEDIKRDYENRMIESSKLADENFKLREENQELRVVNSQLQGAMSQIRDELGISSIPVQPESPQYRIAA